MSRLDEMLCSQAFKELFQELGWDHASARTLIAIDGQEFAFEAVAQKRGLAVLHCVVDRVVLADRTFLRKAQRQLLKLFHEHIAIYTSEEPRKQVWQWAIFLPDGRKVRHREHPFFSVAPPTPFVARIERLRFQIHEEENATIIDALDRVRAVLDTTADLALFVRRPRLARLSDQLARLVQAGDLAAFHKFILLHRPLARRISKRLERWFAMDPDDAEQTAVIGLIMAAKKFKPELGFQFSTYATHWIKQACQRLGPDFALAIHVPQYVFWPCFRLQRQMDRMAERQAMERVRDEVLAQIEKDRVLSKNWQEFQRVTHVQRLRASKALVAPVSNPDEAVLHDEHIALIRTAIAALRPRDALIIRRRYGIDGPMQTLEEIGTALSLTRERVRQLQNRAEVRLHSLLEKQGLLSNCDAKEVPQKG